MSITINGLEQLSGKIGELESTGGIEQAMKKACALVEGEARKKAPKDTGELRRSIASRVDISGSDIKGIIYSPLEYAPYIEFGTGLFAESNGRKAVPWWYQDDEGEWHSTCGIHPQPYLRPALNENREQIIKLLKGGLTE